MKPTSKHLVINKSMIPERTVAYLFGIPDCSNSHHVYGFSIFIGQGQTSRKARAHLLKEAFPSIFPGYFFSFSGFLYYRDVFTDVPRSIRGHHGVPPAEVASHVRRTTKIFMM